MSEEIQIIHKVGWWDKEINRGYLTILKYRPRFLILTNTHLKYYHQSPLEASGNVPPAKEIPIHQINEQSMFDRATNEPDILHIEFGVDSKTYRFRNQNVDEVSQWRAHISAGKGRTSQAKVHFNNLPTKPVVSGTSPAEKVETKYVNNKEVTDWMLVYEQVKEEVLEMELATCASAERAKYTANCFFDSLQSIASKDRNNLAKEMGKAMLAWLDTDYESSIVLDEASLSTIPGASQRSWTKMDVFTIWLRIALSREYLSSCKFEDQGTNDDASSESSSNMTHSTIKSRMRKARLGSIIMPFRADTPETLFISSIIHSASFKYHLLNQLLHTMLRPVAQMPDNFVYPRPLSMNVPTIMSTPLEVGGRGAMAEEKMSNNNFSRRSRRFIGDVVRNLLRINANTASGTTGSVATSGSEPPILEVGGGGGTSNGVSSGGRISSMRLESNSIDLPPGSRPSLADESPPPPTSAPLLTPIELQRIEVRKRLLDLMNIFCQRFEDTATIQNFPRPLSNIVFTIRDLIIVTRPENIVVPRPQDMLGDTRMLEEEREIMYKNRMRFEFGTFFTSCSALLFLRMICRAVISPEEYGVLERLNTSDDRSTSIGAEETIEDPRVARSRHSFAPMVILSHVIRKDTKAVEAMETGSDGSQPQTGVSRPSRRHRTDYNNDSHGGSSSSFINSILSAADDLTTKVPRPAATKCLDYLQSHKYSFHDWIASSQGKTVGISVPKPLSSSSSPTAATPAPTSVAEGGDDDPYTFDVSKPNTRWALAEVAKTLQHIANISCLPTEEMFTFARESLIRQNIQAGIQDRESYDTHQLTAYEEETINIQLQIASKIKEGYERLAELPSGNW